jgi:hypothetical protein
MKFISLICFVAAFGFSSPTPDLTEFPVPPYSKKSLFYIHRSPNPNTVIYEVNLTDKNMIDPENPVKVYWIRYGEKGQQRDLNYIERTFAYGVKAETITQNSYKLQFVASKEKSFVASIDENGQACATMKINGRQSKLTKIFVQVAEEGWWPKVAYVEFFGLDAETGKAAYEKMIIK